MAKGFILGAAWGGLLSIAAAGGLSLYVGAPTPGPGPYPVAAQKPAQPEPDATPETTPDAISVAPARRPAAETGVAAPTSPELGDAGDVPAPDVTADTDPIAAPDAAIVGDALSAPEAPADSADIAVGGDVPVQPGVPTQAPAAPEAETDLSISTDPAQPPAPVVPDQESGLVAQADADASDSSEGQPADAEPGDPVDPEATLADTQDIETAALAPDVTSAEPEAPVAPPQTTAEAPVAPQSEPEAPQPAAQTPETPQAIADAPDAPVVPQDTTEASTSESETATATAPTDAAESDPVDAPETAVVAPDTDIESAASIGDTSRPAIGTPAGSLLSRDTAVSTSRLPRVGGEQPFTPAVLPETSDSPIDLYGAPSDVADDLPRMAIILIDSGNSPLNAATLTAFPFPLSIAIAPGHPDVDAAVEGYRALGFDILALTDVPEGAKASDVEVAIGATLDAVPQAVGVMERPGGSLQASRDITSQVASALLESGHGLIMVPNGLNTAQALVARDGVPSASVFRDFDGAGQDPRVMRRFLDQAAFRARQEGTVVMLGRMQADTISALLLWGLQDRAATVALVPVSTVLKEAR